MFDVNELIEQLAICCSSQKRYL